MCAVEEETNGLGRPRWYYRLRLTRPSTGCPHIEQLLVEAIDDRKDQVGDT